MTDFACILVCNTLLRPEDSLPPQCSHAASGLARHGTCALFLFVAA